MGVISWINKIRLSERTLRSSNEFVQIGFEMMMNIMKNEKSVAEKQNDKCNQNSAQF